jgi:hypothetical protein
VQCQLLQRVRLIPFDVRALVLRKAEDEDPALSPVCRDQHAEATALSLSGTTDPLLEKATAEIGIEQTVSQLLHGFAEPELGQSFLACPTVKPSRLVDRHGSDKRRL